MRKSFSLFLILISCLGLSCASPTPLQHHPQLPMVEGGIESTTTAKGRTKVDVRVKNLPKAGSLNPGATLYVVWVTPMDGIPENIGVLKFNKFREGKLKQVTKFKDFQLSITAEASALVTYPTGGKLLWVNVFYG